MKNESKILFIVAILLFFISHTSLASFCCRDAIVNQYKCWVLGTCCGGDWYEGCSCLLHPKSTEACINAPSPQYLCNYNGEIDETICCPIGYWSETAGIEGYYCYCSFFSNCTWLFVPNITNVYPNNTLIDIDRNVTFQARIIPDKNLIDPSNDIDVARICWYENCSSIACELLESSGLYTCSVPASLIGLGNRYFYVWANDTHTASNTAGVFTFLIENITIGKLKITGDTSIINISGYDVNYTFAKESVKSGLATCWINDKSNSCSSNVENGKFSSCTIPNPELVRNENIVYCTIEDSFGIDGNKRQKTSLSAQITQFELAKPETGTAGPNSEIVFNITVLNSGEINWNGNVKVRINETKQNLGTVCEFPIKLESGKETTTNCTTSAGSPGSYEFKAYVIYTSPTKEIILAESSLVQLQVITLTIDLEFIGLDYGLVLPCVSGSGCEANYSRGQEVLFRVKAKYWPNPYYYYECSSIFGSDYCKVEFKDPETGVWKPMQGFGNEWIDKANTSNLACDANHKLEVKVIRSGIEARAWKFFTVSCIPRVTVVPNIVRLSVGENASHIFNVTIWNPTDENKTFDLEMYTKPSWFQSWLSLSPHDVNEPWKRSNIFIPSIGRGITSVNISQTGRAGSYEVVFDATEKDSGSQYKGKGYVFIYAEGMSEFGIVGVFILIIFSIFIYIFIRRTKIR